VANAELIVSLIGRVDGFQKAMGQVARDLNRTGRSIQAAGRQLNTLSLPLAGIGALSVKTAIDFETAFTGVRKTVDATEAEFAALRTGIVKMSKEIPASTTRISAVAEAAGQLGIQTKHILSFSRVMIDLGNTTNLSADEAATALARLANITQMPQEQFDRLGSTVVELGNNFATTEAEIVEMGLRLAGAGKVIGLSEAQILSFATALSSVGIQAEAGGSAFSRVMRDIATAVALGSDKLDEFAKIAGVSTAEFKRTFEEDAAGALLQFIEGLARIEEQGGSAIVALDAVDLSAIRVSDSLLRLANAGKLTRDAVAMGTEAWEENTALTKEAELRYETLASQIQVAMNRLSAAAVVIGEVLMPHVERAVTAIGELADWFASLSPEVQSAVVKLGAVVAVLGPALILVGQMVTGVAAMIKVFATAKTAAALLASSTGIGAIALALGAAVAAIWHFRDDIASGLAHAWEVAKEVAQRLTDVFKASAKMLLFFWGTSLEELTAVFKTFGGIVVKLFSVVANGVAEFLKYLFESGKALVNDLSRLFARMFDLVVRAFERIEKVAGRFSSRAQKAFGDMRRALDGLRRPIEATTDNFGRQEAAAASLKEEIESTSSSLGEFKKETGETTLATGDLSGVLDKLGRREEEAAKKTAKLRGEKKKLNRDVGVLNSTLGETSFQIGNLSSVFERLIDMIGGDLGDALKSVSNLLSQSGSGGLGDILSQLITGGSGGGGLFGSGGILGSGYGISSSGAVGAVPGAPTVIGGSFVGGGSAAAGTAGGASAGAGAAGAAGAAGSGLLALLGPLGIALAGLAITAPVYKKYGEMALDGDLRGDDAVKAAMLAGPHRTMTGPLAIIMDYLGLDLGIKSGKDREQLIRDAHRDRLYEMGVISDPNKRGKGGRYAEFEFVGGGYGSLAPGSDNFNQVSGVPHADEYNAVGNVLAASSGAPGDSQLAAMFANALAEADNFNVAMLTASEMLVKMSGSAEKAQEDIIAMALDGTISVEEMNAMLNTTRELMSGDIAGATADVHAAIELLGNTAGSTTRDQIKALGTVFNEVRQAGIQDSAAMVAYMTDKYGPEIGAVFQKLVDHGIDQFTDLNNVGVDQMQSLINIVGPLAGALEGDLATAADAAGGALDETATSAVETFKELNRELDKTVRKFDELARKRVDSAGAGGDVTQSYRGNVFSAGRVMQFAKGGAFDKGSVVGGLSFFNIGSMAERGPEAIMPLERLPDGRLGVLSASSSNGGGYGDIYIDARYAQRGVAAEIKRELKELLDKRNGPLGVR